MTIATFMQRFSLILVLLQVLWLTACDEEQEPSPKTVIIQNIMDEITISEAGKDAITASGDGSSFIKFRQEGGASHISTEGLYFIVLFIPDDSIGTVIDDITNVDIQAREVLNYGNGIALAKIHNKTAERRILNFSTNTTEVGYYWEADTDAGNFRICTLLITPDARFVLRADFSKSAVGNLREYRINYGSEVDMIVAFKASTLIPPQELLGDDAVDYILGRLM
jgi:hypothetical protein